MSVFTNPSTHAADDAAAYVKAVLELVGNREPLEKLRQPEREGKWAIVHVLQHLADADIVWAWRMRLILAQDRPTLTGYDQDLWAQRLHYAETEPNEALELFDVMRRGNLRLLSRATSDDLARVGVHAERGEESLDHLRRLYAGHDQLHLRQIARIRRAVS